jgi:hypothetical protein
VNRYLAFSSAGAALFGAPTASLIGDAVIAQLRARYANGEPARVSIVGHAISPAAIDVWRQNGARCRRIRTLAM